MFVESVNSGYYCGNRKNGLFCFFLSELNFTYGCKATRLENKAYNISIT